MNAFQWLEDFLQVLVAGLLTGAVYGLLCVGLSLIFGVMRVINFAQGDFMMMGMYVAYYAFGAIFAHLVFGPFVAPYVAALIAGPVTFLAGILVHKFLVSRVSGVHGIRLEAEGHYAQLILTLGLSLIMQNGGLYVFGSAPLSIPTPLASSAWDLNLFGADLIHVFVNKGQAIAAVIAVAIVIAFVSLMTRSQLGNSMRAASDNPDAAIYMGIDVNRAYRLAFGFGVAVTATGGGLLASGSTFQPYIGIEYVVIMYAGVVLGGLGSVVGAFFGGLIIGLVQQLSTLFLPNQLQNTAIFVVFLIVMLMRPQGLFGMIARRA